jgi:hypothetical protein
MRGVDTLTVNDTATLVVDAIENSPGQQLEVVGGENYIRNLGRALALGSVKDQDAHATVESLVGTGMLYKTQLENRQRVRGSKGKEYIRPAVIYIGVKPMSVIEEEPDF